MNYAEKLKDPRWQKKRLEILNRDEWTCQGCFDTYSTLHVHHKRYIKGNDPWDCPDSILITLCEDCHAAEDVFNNCNELNDAVREKFLSYDIGKIADGFKKYQLNHQSEVCASVLRYFLSNPELVDAVTDLYFKSISQKTESNA